MKRDPHFRNYETLLARVKEIADTDICPGSGHMEESEMPEEAAFMASSALYEKGVTDYVWLVVYAASILREHNFVLHPERTLTSTYMLPYFAVKLTQKKSAKSIVFLLDCISQAPCIKEIIQELEALLDYVEFDDTSS